MPTSPFGLILVGAGIVLDSIIPVGIAAAVEVLLAAGRAEDARVR